MVPRDRLLEYEVRGWGPLCRFLGVEIPDHEFPWANDREELRRFVWKLAREASWRVLGGFMKGLAEVGVVSVVAIWRISLRPV
jgi:hypothetical protein